MSSGCRRQSSTRPRASSESGGPGGAQALGRCILWPTVDTERVLAVAIVWISVLAAVLAGREIVRARHAWDRRALRLMNGLVVIMMLAVGSLGIVLGVSFLSDDGRTGHLVPTGTAGAGAHPIGPAKGSSTTPTLSQSPATSATPSVSSALEPTPLPTRSMPPGTASPRDDPTASVAEPDTGIVEAGPTLWSYSVDRSRVTGFVEIRAPERIRAQASAPAIYALPSLTDPRGTILLTMVLSGDFAGTYLSPEDEGVTYTP